MVDPVNIEFIILTAVALLACFLLGLGIGWLITRAVYAAKLGAAREETARIADMKAGMADAFSALSTRVMQENSKSFLDLAGQTFARHMASAEHGLENREKAVREVVRPVAEALEKYDLHVRSMEMARQKAYGELSQQVASLNQSQNELQRETGKLVSALRQSHVRGRWGEITLRRVVELAGMQNRCDFFEQQTAQTGVGALRPDMVIHLPGDRKIIVDSKVSLTAYLDAAEAEAPDQAEAMLERHARHVQTHIQKLALKEYWTQFTPTPEFVVLFMPGENFFSAALSKLPGLIEEAAAKGVILATPTTLISLLKSVAYGWQQETVAQNARLISDLGAELHSRLASMVAHINALGRDLARCVGTYNKTVGSLERRVLVSARKLADLGVGLKGAPQAMEVCAVESIPRRMEEDSGDNGRGDDPDSADNLDDDRKDQGGHENQDMDENGKEPDAG
jgi:DNA recombination protein RmuC